MAHKGYTKGHRVTQVIKKGEVTPSVISDYTLSDVLFSVEDSSFYAPVRSVLEDAECDLDKYKPRLTQTQTHRHTHSTRCCVA